MVKKTSEKWQKICKVTVYDPDGWDRKNYQHSWYEEKISRAEFEYRMLFSTCVGFQPLGSCIWKDFPYILFWHIWFIFKKSWIAIKAEVKRPSVWDYILPKMCVYLSIFTVLMIIVWGIVQTFMISAL